MNGIRFSGRVAAALLAACLLAGCEKPAEPTRQSAVTLAGDPHAAEQAEMEKGSMDFSHVRVVRLKRDGKRLEVTSIMPLVVAETRVSGEPAKTIFRVNEAGNGLVLFSRDIPKSSSFRTEMSFSELESRRVLSFPVVQPDGTLQENSFELEKILTPN